VGIFKGARVEQIEMGTRQEIVLDRCAISSKVTKTHKVCCYVAPKKSIYHKKLTPYDPQKQQI